MIKKLISIMLITTMVLTMLPSLVMAERVLPEKTNAYSEHNPERGLAWLSNQSLVEKIVETSAGSYRGDENLLKLAKNSIIISTSRTYGYINGYRADVSDTKNVYPILIDEKIYVPVKFADLSVSGNAVYNEAENLVTITHGSYSASCTPVISDGIVYLPVRDVYEALGREVVYAGKGTVIITTSSNKSLITDDICFKVSDPDFYIERSQMVHPSSAIRWVIHSSEVRGFATAGETSVKSAMNSYLSSANISQSYLDDKSLSDAYPEGSRSLSNLLTMSYHDLADYIDYSSMYYTYTNDSGVAAKRARHIGERASYERAAGYFARLYELSPKANEDLALRTIIMLYHTALRFDELDTSYRTDDTFLNYAYVTPHFLVYAYDKVYHSPMWEAFKAGYGVDAKAVVEKYFRTIYNYICANYKGSKTISNYPLIMEHTAGIGIALDDPDIIRFTMERLNSSVNPLSFYADGMWYEGSVDYGSQMVGHAYGAARIIKEYRDRRCYTDDIFGLNIKLDGKQDTKTRWTQFFDYVDSLKVDSSNFSDTAFAYPDGSPLAVNDVHWQKSSSNVASNTIKVNDFSKNIEMNHFGLYGLRYGNSTEAQQLNLSIQATTGVSHQHSGYLAMSYYSGGMELLPDIGYVTSGNNRYMSTATYSHNTATAFESTGHSSTDVGSFYARPNVLAYDDGSSNGKQIQLIEGSNLMPNTVTTNFAYDYGVDMNRRMLLMIATDENHSYAVDIHRIKGSKVRESYLISSQDEDTSLVCNLYGLTDYSGKLIDWLKTEKSKTGGSLLSANSLYSGKLTNPKGVITSDDFSFTWQGATASLNAFIKGNDNSTVAFSAMPAVRRVESNSSAKANHFYRRVDVDESSDEVTTFASLYEGVKAGESAKIKAVTWPTTGSDTTTSLIVEHESGLIDYIYTSTDTTIRNLGIYQMGGAVCFLRTDSAGNVISSYIYGDGVIKVRATQSIILQGKADVTYSVTKAQGSRFSESGVPNELTLSGTLPEYAKGSWGRVDFADGSGIAFKVNSIDGTKIGIQNDPGFYMDGENAVFTSYPMYEDISKPGRIAEWASPIPKNGTVSQRTRGNVTFTIKIPTFSQITS